jgi:PAS domain S-box-containing protein
VAADVGDPAGDSQAAAAARNTSPAEGWQAQTLSRLIASAPLILWTVNTEGVVTLSEGAGLAALGLQPGEAVGQKIREQYADVGPGIRLMERALAGEACSGLLDARGRVLDVHFFPERDERGTVVGATGMALDVTARATAERAAESARAVLSGAAEEWRATFDAVGSPLLLLDAHGHVKRLNRAARDFWGQAGFQEIIGRALRERQGEPWIAMARAAEEAQRSLEPRSATVADADGRTWDISASPLTLPGGTTGVILLARDISPLVALQQSLRRSETMSAMGTLLSGVAHEVRNPLFGISAAIDAFHGEFSDREEYRQYASLLRNEVARLTTLMRDLLEYGRPAQTELEPGRLGDVIQRAVRLCSLRAREGGVELVTQIDPDLPLVSMEAGRLVQVFQNVVENAVQHSPSGGQVTISASVGADGMSGVRCQVLDAGPGFRAQDRARVFEPFYTRRRGGTGLGLSIVQKIVEEHGGAVAVANRAPGGAVVTIDLPAASGAGTVEEG